MTVATPRFVLGAPLGGGATCETLLGTMFAHDGVERRVVIKRLRAALADDREHRRRFRDEAALHAQLHHGAIVGFVDYVELDGRPCLVLDHVDGFDAVELVRRSLPVVAALYVAKLVAEALTYVHGLRDAALRPLEIVHRDVGPRNVILAFSADVALLDFSTAVSRTRAAHTPTGLAHGTPAFMAPEQLLRGRVDRRADVFALGCLLHYLLTGHSPIEAQKARLHHLRGDELELSPGVLGAAYPLIRQATMLARDQRHTTMAELAAELDHLLCEHHRTDGRRATAAWLVRQRGEAAAAAVGTLDRLIVATPPDPID